MSRKSNVISEKHFNGVGDGIMAEERREELLTVREVARRLRVDDTTVRRWIKSGALEAITLPHRGKRQAYRIKKSTLDNLLTALSRWHSDQTNCPSLNQDFDDQKCGIYGVSAHKRGAGDTFRGPPTPFWPISQKAVSAAK